MKQTAVEWMEDQLKQVLPINQMNDIVIQDLFKQAKEMEKENMVVFLQSVFGMEGFDYEKCYDDFISRRKNTKEELPKTEIDWSGFPKSTQEQVGFTEPNIIDEWLDKNGSPEIAKQVEEEVKELCGETLEEAVEFWANEASWCCPVSFESGAKWQQEKSYSEEDAKLIFEAGKEYWKTSGGSITIEELLEKINLNNFNKEDKDKTPFEAAVDNYKTFYEGKPSNNNIPIDAFVIGAKWQQEQDKNKYSGEEVLAFGKSCFYKGFEKAEKDDANCYTAFREEIGSLVEQFKKQVKNETNTYKNK